MYFTKRIDKGEIKMKAFFEMFCTNVKATIIAAVCVVVAITVVVGVLVASSSKKDVPEIVSQSTLERIVNISNLSTSETVYNGIVTVLNEENPENVDYYVSYESKVKAGFDFGKLVFDVNEGKRIINVKLPEIEITDINVDITSLDYMFMNKKANTSTVTEQAYRLCNEDVIRECNSENAVFEVASNNAKNVIMALLDPFMQQLGKNYKLVIE